jgi:hypothetical protein
VHVSKVAVVATGCILRSTFVTPAIVREVENLASHPMKTNPVIPAASPASKASVHTCRVIRVALYPYSDWSTAEYTMTLSEMGFPGAIDKTIGDKIKGLYLLTFNTPRGAFKLEKVSEKDSSPVLIGNVFDFTTKNGRTTVNCQCPGLTNVSQIVFTCDDMVGESYEVSLSSVLPDKKWLPTPTDALEEKSPEDEDKPPVLPEEDLPSNASRPKAKMPLPAPPPPQPQSQPWPKKPKPQKAEAPVRHHNDRRFKSGTEVICVPGVGMGSASYLARTTFPKVLKETTNVVRKLSSMPDRVYEVLNGHAPEMVAELTTALNDLRTVLEKITKT